MTPLAILCIKHLIHCCRIFGGFDAGPVQPATAAVAWSAPRRRGCLRGVALGDLGAAHGTSPASVSEHALWVGVIGWLASSLQGAMNLGIIPADPSAGGALTSAETIAPALMWSVLGCLTVHALGQVTYPGPRRMRRQAVLSVRRIRDFLPRRLALTTAAIFLTAAAAIARTATLPGFAAVAPTTVRDGPNSYSYYSGGGDGRIPGTEVAGWLGGALLVLAGGTWLVLWLIASRRQLESLDAADNAVLRTIAMNRLLRTVATVAAGLGMIAGNFAARPDPAQGITSWTNPAGLAGMVVLLVMWWWRPPRLAAAGLGVRNRPEAGTAAGRQHPAARLISSLGALLGLAAAVPLVAGVFLAQAIVAAASVRFCGVRGVDGRPRAAGHCRRRAPAAAQLRQPGRSAQLAPAAGEPRPADHRRPGAARLPHRPGCHGGGECPPGRGPGLGSGRTAHGRSVRRCPARRSSRRGAAGVFPMPRPAWTLPCAPSPSTGWCGPLRPPSPPRPGSCC